MADEAPGNGPPRYELLTWLVLGAVVLAVLGLATVRMQFDPDTSREYASRTLPPEPEPTLRPPPQMDEEFWPCSDCHEDEPTNRERRVLEEEHDDLELAHGNLWCLSCHHAEDRDSLTLSDGTPVRFEDSWQLCTQCHGQRLAEWRAGVHGKRTGHWWGPKEYRSCVECHDPHSPPFKKLEPKPPPRRPEEIRSGGAEVSHESR